MCARLQRHRGPAVRAVAPDSLLPLSSGALASSCPQSGAAVPPARVTAARRASAGRRWKCTTPSGTHARVASLGLTSRPSSSPRHPLALPTAWKVGSHCHIASVKYRDRAGRAARRTSPGCPWLSEFSVCPRLWNNSPRPREVWGSGGSRSPGLRHPHQDADAAQPPLKTRKQPGSGSRGGQGNRIGRQLLGCHMCCVMLVISSESLKGSP